MDMADKVWGGRPSKPVRRGRAGVRFFRVSVFSVVLACACIHTAAGDEKWCEIRSPNFTVVSDAPVRQARHAARSLEQFRAVLQKTLPTLKVDAGFPLLVFAARDAVSLKGLIPADREEPGAAQPQGFFLSDPGRNIAVFRMDDKGEPGYRAMYHEYVHMVTNLNFRNLPLWLFEGLAELYSLATVSGEASGLGRTNSEYLEFLKASSLIPLNVLMSVTRESPYYRRRDMSRIFYAQSWALTHYLILGDRQAHSGRLMEFLRLIRNNVPEREAAELAFGDLKALERDLEKYIRGGKFYYAPVDSKLGAGERKSTARKLPVEESLALRGELLVRVNRPEEAKPLIEEALKRNPGSAAAHEAMALLQLRLGDRDLAWNHFSRAANLNLRSFLAQYYCAELAFLRNRDHEAAEKYLRRALAINPKFAPAYHLMSVVLMLQAERLAEALGLAMKAADLEPGEFRHWAGVCRIQIAMERYEEAGRLAQRLLETARSQEEVQQAQVLLAMMPGLQHRALEARRQANEAREESRMAAEGQIASAELETPLGDRDVPRGGLENRGVEILEGQVRSVLCAAPAVMDVEVEADDGRHRLRAEDYRQVAYRRGGSVGSGGSGEVREFEPCRELKGKRVRIGFFRVAGKEYSGFIRTVDLED